MYNSKISGTGSYLPENTLTNEQLTKMVDTNDEWIRTRTGISSRHIVAQNEAGSDLAFRAAQEALKSASLEATDLDAILVATVTSDYVFPSTATILQARLGCRKIFAMDLAAACAGFLYGLTLADHMIQSGKYRHILLLGVETLSRITNYQDRETCILFGDGSGAVILSRMETNDSAVLYSHVEAEGDGGKNLGIWLGGGRDPITSDTVDSKDRYLHMSGREVFREAVASIAGHCSQALDTAKLAIAKLDWLLVHQANKRIIDTVANRLKLDPEKVLINIDHVGNTSSASIPILLDEKVKDGHIVRGQTLLMSAFGGGFTSGAVLLRY